MPAYSRRGTAADASPDALRKPSMVKFIKAGVQVDLVKPDYKSHDKPTVVRFLPGIEPCVGPQTELRPGQQAGTQFAPYRLTNAYRGFGGWIVLLPTVSFAGTKSRVSFITHDPWDKQYDLSEHPYQILVSEIRRAVKAKVPVRANGKKIDPRLWHADIHGDMEEKSLPPIKYTGFANVALYVDQGKPTVSTKGVPKGLGPRERPQMLQLTQASATSLVGLEDFTGQVLSGVLDTRTDAWSMQASVKDAFVYGDVLDLNAGKFVAFVNPKHHDVSTVTATEEEADYIMQTQLQQALAQIAEDEAKPRADGSDGFSTCQAVVLDRLKVKLTGLKATIISPRIAPLERVIWERSRDLYETLYLPTHDEICVWLAQAFSATPEMLHYAWADHRDFFSDEVRGILAMREQGFIPADQDGDALDAEELSLSEEEPMLAPEDMEEDPEALLDEAPPPSTLESRNQARVAQRAAATQAPPAARPAAPATRPAAPAATRPAAPTGTRPAAPAGTRPAATRPATGNRPAAK